MQFQQNIGRLNKNVYFPALLMLTNRDSMKVRTLALVIIMIVLTVLVSGCTDILTKQRVGGFGDAQGNTSTGSTYNGISGSPTTPNTGTDLQRGSVYTVCYQNCVQYGKQTSDDCDKGCCMAECNSKSPGDIERCAASCGVDLSKKTGTKA